MGLEATNTPATIVLGAPRGGFLEITVVARLFSFGNEKIVNISGVW
jgi:hypothetical protein